MIGVGFGDTYIWSGGGEVPAQASNHRQKLHRLGRRASVPSVDATEPHAYIDDPWSLGYCSQCALPAENGRHNDPWLLPTVADVLCRVVFETSPGDVFQIEREQLIDMLARNTEAAAALQAVSVLIISGRVS